MTLVLLDTNAYLRLAKRVKPLLGIEFGQKQYELSILKIVEDEINNSPKLKYKFPWLDDAEFATERLAKRIRYNNNEKAELKAATSILRAHVLSNAALYTSQNRSPPSYTDCFCLSYSQVRSAIVVTDDLGMHLLAGEFELSQCVWHGHELLKKMLGAKVIKKELVLEIFEALENNNDLPSSWRTVKHTSFKKIFGPSSK